MSGETRRAWARRLTPLLLLVLALVLFRILAPSFPTDHDVVYDLGSDAARVIRLEVAWRHADRPEEEPQVSVSWHFDAGKAPRRLASTVRLPKGAWEVSALVGKTRGETREIARRVTLDEGTTTVRLE